MTGSTRFHFLTFGNRTAPALLFLHGFMGSISDFRDMITAFKTDFFCIAVDLPGHGHTVVADENDFDMDKCAANLVHFLSDMGVNRCNVIGYSMGGRLAFYLAVNYPELFGKMVIESASPGLESASEREARAKHDMELAEKLIDIPFEKFLDEWYSQPLFSTLDRNSHAFAELRKSRLLNNPINLATSLKKMGAGIQPSLWGRLNEIKSEILLIVGGKDAKFRHISDEVAKRCGSASVAVVGDAGHNVHFEKPDEFIEHARAFLKS